MLSSIFLPGSSNPGSRRIDLSAEIKREAVRLRKESGLKLPDAIVCATAKIKSATLLTNDDRLLGVAGVTSARVVVARP
jgi:predicted nucleic acid-binding protein